MNFYPFSAFKYSILGGGGLLLLACQVKEVAQRPLTPVEYRQVKKADRKMLKELLRSNINLMHDFQVLKKKGNWKKRGYFSAQESDNVEHLLFRLHAIHSQLTNLTKRYYREKKKGDAQVYERARALMLEQARGLVSLFKGDRIAIDKLNQRYPRSEVPAYTYSELSGLLKSKVERDAEDLSRKLKEEITLSAYQVRAQVFEHVSRFKNPSAHLIRFSESQKKQVINLLEPGDIILTYTSGYVSSMFIPGVFKHSIIYVGGLEERRKAGLLSKTVHYPSKILNRRRLMQRFQQTKTIKGRPANVIESIAEGVKFSNLEHIMDTHINRIAVIRPRLTPKQRELYLSRVFSYLGQEYDFLFDFSDSSRQVCTELLYRSLNGIGGVNFPLSTYAGKLSMTADDVIRYALKQNPNAFEFVLFCDEKKMSPSHKASLKTGKSGELKLKKLMKITT